MTVSGRHFCNIVRNAGDCEWYYLPGYGSLIGKGTETGLWAGAWPSCFTFPALCQSGCDSSSLLNMAIPFE